MKLTKIFAAILMALVSVSAMAACPTQKTTIFFINGVNTEEKDATVTQLYLERILKPFPWFNPSCVTVKLAYNRTEGLTPDILEAARQKEIEENLTPTHFWEMFTRVRSTRPWFVEIMANVFRGPPDFRDRKIFAQLNEHLNTLYRAEPEDTNLMLFGHSQGTLFGNESWLAMTPQEKDRTKLLAVATPAFAIVDGGPYTTIEEDKLITNTFVGELEPNVPAPNRLDDELCPDDWWCHGIETSYLFPNTASRIRILADVKRLLPEEPPPPTGAIYQSFVEGDPGLPGDGRTITPDGGITDVLFEIEPVFPLAGIASGITVSAFPTTERILSSLRLQVNLSARGKPVTVCNNVFGTSSGPTLLTPLVNGVGGLAVNASRSTLEEVAATIRRNPSCSDVTVDDLLVHSLIVTPRDGSNVIIQTLDALAIGIGENVFP